MTIVQGINARLKKNPVFTSVLLLDYCMSNQTKVNGKKLRLLISDGFILQFSKLY